MTTRPFPTGPDIVGQILDTRMWPTELAERVCKINDLDNSQADRIVPVNHALYQLRQKDDEIGRLRDQVATLRPLAEAAADYYEAICLGFTLARTDSEIDERFESEVRAYLIRAGRLKPDPADDPSIAERLGK